MSSGSAVTRLDAQLYAWLAEADEHRFQRAFSAYFKVAFPLVMRHLLRLSRWDPANLEELAQDALLRFFDKVGRGRREASETVRAALAMVRPLPLGNLHAHRVKHWTFDIGSFRDTAMSFRIDAATDPSADAATGTAPFKSAIRALAERIPALQDRGGQLVQEANTASWPAEGPPPDTTSFVTNTALVVEALPALRVPSNGYLFEIAMTIYLDECKRRGRQKRGGSGYQEPLAHPLEQLDGTFDEVELGDTAVEDVGPTAAGSPVGLYAIPQTDPTREYEDVEFLEQFYAYLRRPLDEAGAAYERARVGSRAVAELKKVDSIRRKFDRMIAVLTLLGEGHTQDQIAAQLDLSRNQVKYVIELVQESYAAFGSAAAGLPQVSGEGVATGV